MKDRGSTIEGMPPVAPTTLAVSDAIAHYRQLQDLTCNELSYVLSLYGHELPSEDIARMERAEQAVTVDDLMALAHALDTTPTALLSHARTEPPEPEEGPIATGLPDDLVQDELVDWMTGRTALDDESRIRWWQEHASRLDVLLTHLEEQLEGAKAELDDLGELAAQEADAPPVQRLHARIREVELAAHLTERAQAMAGMRLDELRGTQ